MPITDPEYEGAYAEALFCLADDGHTGGIPFANVSRIMSKEFISVKGSVSNGDTAGGNVSQC
jgi:hypothetical protein